MPLEFFLYIVVHKKEISLVFLYAYVTKAHKNGACLAY